MTGVVDEDPGWNFTLRSIAAVEVEEPRSTLSTSVVVIYGP